VSVRLLGSGQLTEVMIDPDLPRRYGVDGIGALVVEAVNDGMRRMRQASAARHSPAPTPAALPAPAGPFQTLAAAVPTPAAATHSPVPTPPARPGPARAGGRPTPLPGGRPNPLAGAGAALPMLAAPRRVTVAAGDRRVDVALPAQCTIAEAVAELVRLLGLPAADRAVAMAGHCTGSARSRSRRPARSRPRSCRTAMCCT
jgi:WXG100 protein secretion system (Wss), protein YukD